MTRTRLPAHSPPRSLSVSIVRSVFAALLAALPVVIVDGASAQPPPLPVPATPTPMSDGVVATAQQSIGMMTIGNKEALGWIGGDGVVLASDEITTGVGRTASFVLANSDEVNSCYVADVNRGIHLAAFRCGGVEGEPLDIDPRYPATSTPVAAIVLASRADDKPVLGWVGGSVSTNDIEFMGVTRPRFSFTTATSTTTSAMTPDNAVGAVVVNGEGKVISTVMALPESGTDPLGATAKELGRLVSTALSLPPSFGAAAVISVGRRAIIPSGIGLIVGLIWGYFRRDGSLLVKVLGLSTLGLIGAVAVSLAAVLIVGPETLVS